MNQGKSLNLVIMVVSLLLLLISFCYDTQNTFLLIFPSFLILLITSVPVLMGREHNVFSPLNYLIYFIFLNLIVRNLYIIYDYPSESYVSNIFLLFKSKDTLVKPLVVMLISFMSFTLGYLFYSRRRPVRDEKLITWNSKKLNVLSVVLLFVSFVSLVKFIISSKVNILMLTLQTFSAYRGVTKNLEDYDAHGFLRVLIQLSVIVFYINYIYYKRSVKKTFWNRLFIFLSFLISILFFFFVQSRSGVIFIFINCFVINYYLKGGRFSYKSVSLLFVSIVVLFSFMTSLRGGSGFDLKEAVEDSLFTILDPLVANNGGVDVSKTGHIMEYVNTHDDFKYGWGYLWLGSSFIPRSIWSNKPVSMDTEVGMKVYNAGSYGSGAVPPGLVAESYWNFGYLGILVVPFFVGVFTRVLHNYFRIIYNDNNKILLYVICFMGVPYSCFGSSIVSMLLGVIYLFVPLQLSLKFITKVEK